MDASAPENLGLPSSGRRAESASLTYRHLSPSDPSIVDYPSCLQALLATKDDAKLLKDELKSFLAAAAQQLEHAEAEIQASTTQLNATNAHVTEPELKLDSSKLNVATNKLEKPEPPLLSLSHPLADIRHAVDQVLRTVQATSRR